MTHLRISAILPALNEANNLGRVLDEFPAGLVDEVIVVDGGSTDGTPEVAAQHGARVIIETRRGYGRACARGAAAATGDVLVFLDADGADMPADMPALLAPIQAGAADMVLGSRLRKPLPRNAMPAHQYLGNRLAGLLIRLLYRQPISDLAPYRAVRADMLAMLHMREMTYGWPTEMIVKALRKGYRVQELAVGYRPRFSGHSKISGTLKGTLLSAYYILSTTFRYAFRRP